MKISKLQGGLGNQMFQYAVVRALETKKNKNVYLDLVFLETHNKSEEHFSARKYELNIFKNIRATHLSNSCRTIFLSTNLFIRIIRRLLNIRAIKQTNDHYVNLPDNRNIYLDGYFQSEKYFRNIRKDLLKDFEFIAFDDEKNRIIYDKIANSNSVSIHVRRGDYVSSSQIGNKHGVLPVAYYKQAIDLLSKKIEKEDIDYYIFSDDPAYIKTHFEFVPNCVIIDVNKGDDSWKDLCLMTACKYHIIANSSFSWWGAWLSQREGITIAPSRWFNDEVVSYNIHDFIPDSWYIINF
ncbi:alpha-1,2-fucosyltransferase [Dysgonomonas sp. 520]|uniref:alpha-1,2-fucosyltransferase n=1 Tax=Dysgonomonas sp. 520 TaxID=2302931 RepID=UPI0013D31BFA|nr:alpha-1,2-fucosyltransferase [Dysgonomonas sp. 520]NDW09799.1 alpha-1,2-fucosyltransferase [Dysgonomonas sp. 520]